MIYIIECAREPIIWYLHTQDGAVQLRIAWEIPYPEAGNLSTYLTSIAGEPWNRIPRLYRRTYWIDDAGNWLLPADCRRSPRYRRFGVAVKIRSSCVVSDFKLCTP